MSILDRSAAYTLDERIVPMHAHSGRDRDDFLCALEPGGHRVVSRAEANRIALSRFGIPDVGGGEPEPEAAAYGPAGVPRRTLLRGVAGLGLMGTPSVAPRMAFAAGPEIRDVLVCIFLRGGFDGLSAVFPLDDANYRAARPTIGVASGALPLGGGWGAHPQLSALQPLWAAGELAVVHATGNTDPTRSHFAGMWSTERAAGATAVTVQSGWLGRHLATSSGPEPTFRAITVGTKAVASLSTTFPTLAFSSISEFDIWAWEGVRPHIARMLDATYDRAGGSAGALANTTLDAVARLADLRGTPYVPANGASYPDGPFGDGLQDIARMIKSGKGLEVACLDIGDWDMHAGLGSSGDPNSWFSWKVRELAQGLAAFRTDLGSSWSNVCVITMSEFGRRVGENASGGVDHGHGNAIFVLGGQVAGGRVFGSWPGLSPGDLDLNEGGYNGDVTITTDYRTVLAELLTDRLKNPAVGTVLPNFTSPGPLGIFR